MKLQYTFLAGLVPLSYAAETIVGVYMFHRHGDRTPKVLAPTNLTELGYRQVWLSGQYYNSRYLAPGSATQISGISSNVVNQGQIAASAPLDTVLQNSAQGFLQGFYPPVGRTLGSQTLANGTSIEAPMGGYQLIPVNVVEAGTASENAGWLQDSTGCLNAEVSSNDYFYSTPYKKLYSSTMNFYQRLLPAIKPEFNKSTATYQNAYLIFDYLNVARIHNATYNSMDLVTEGDVFHQLQYLANVHEYNLAYNKSSEIRAIAGAQLAAEIIDFFEGTIAGQGVPKFGIQFNAYSNFFSFFGLAQLPKVSSTFTDIVKYASAMMFELYTTEPFTTFPSEDQLRVRFLFHNGTTSAASPPKPYPLFGQSAMSMSWTDFRMQMHKFSIGSTPEWCRACGNTTGSCAPYAPGASSLDNGSSGGGGMSNAVAGVIGAMVTLGVILLVEGAIFLFGGLSLVRRKHMVAGKAVAAGGNGVTKA